jgi:hypothetical protein
MFASVANIVLVIAIGSASRILVNRMRAESLPKVTAAASFIPHSAAQHPTL